MSPDPRALVAGLAAIGCRLAMHAGPPAFICATRPGGLEDVDRIALRLTKADLLRVLEPCSIAHGPLETIG